MELPKSTAVSILDQYRVDELGLNQHALSMSRIGDISAKDSPLPSISSRVHQTADDTCVTCRHNYIWVWLLTFAHIAIPHHFNLPSIIESSKLWEIEESEQETLHSSRVSYAKMEESRRDPIPSRPSMQKSRKAFLSPSTQKPDSSISYGKIELDSSLISASASDRQPKKKQGRFDPFTGEPYKFDPFMESRVRVDCSWGFTSTSWKPILIPATPWS